VLRDLDRATGLVGLAEAKHASLAELTPDQRANAEIAIAKHVHDAYSAAETAIERLVSEVDGDLPHGRHYHQDLLDRAAQPMPGVRPAMLSQTLAHELRKLLRFRHLFRHVYEDFDYDLAAPNLAVAGRALPGLRDELVAFAIALGLAPRA
jgi:hypothetical protein